MFILQRLAVSAAILTSTVGASLAPIVALADAGSYTDALHANTTGNINFTPDTDSTNPVNPDKPEETVKPDKDINPHGAELMITYASDLNFGTQSKSDTSWNAFADKVKDTSGQTQDIVPFVSVKDSRGTTRDGWKLTVKQDGDFMNGTAALKGATLKFSGLNYFDNGTAPTATGGDITLTDKSQLIASADATHGAGNTSLALGTLNKEYDKGEKKEVNKTAGVNLSIPNGTIINTGEYKTTITYELTAGV